MMVINDSYSMITDRIRLHSVLLPLQIITLENLNGKKLVNIDNKNR